MKMQGWAVGTAAMLGACVHTPSSAPTPSLADGPGSPAPAHARFYVDCIAQATATGRIDREANLLRFRCDGAEAFSFYEGLQDYAREIDSEIVQAGGTWRFTQKIEKDPFGADYCVHDGERARCEVVLNVGPFLNR
jgi:hypothetical protein